MRLFVAVWPDDATVARLAALERPAVEGVRWTEPGQWHVTVQFLGAVAELGPVVEALAALGARECDVTLGPATAWFPGRRVLQLPAAGLDDVAAEVAGRVGMFASGRVAHPGFNGHLTLARARGRPPTAAVAAALAGQALSAAWRACEVTLVASTTLATGASYEVVARAPLASGS